MAVPVEPGSSLRAGSAEVLFPRAGHFSAEQLRQYDLSPNGQRFLRLRAGAVTTDTATVPEVILVQNWFEELKARVPTR